MFVFSFPICGYVATGQNYQPPIQYIAPETVSRMGV